MGWFDRFFAARGSADFIVVLGLLNGMHSYDPSIRLPNGSEEIYSILGIRGIDDRGDPTFDESIVPTVVHEFCHTYSNPLVNRHEGELEAAGTKIFPLVEKAMRDQAYGDWKIMMYESLVRAVSVRFTAAHWGTDAASREIAYNESRQFVRTDEPAKLLGEYEGNRVAYPTLDAFMPRIAVFFADYGGRTGSKLVKLEEQKKEEGRSPRRHIAADRFHSAAEWRRRCQSRPRNDQHHIRPPDAGG